MLLALLVPGRWFYGTPATSFDMVFDRIGLAAELGFVLGFGAGVAAAGRLGRARQDAVRRRNLTIGAALASLGLIAAGIGIATVVP